jgi:hypothetical protein
VLVERTAKWLLQDKVLLVVRFPMLGARFVRTDTCFTVHTVVFNDFRKSIASSSSIATSKNLVNLIFAFQP